VKFHWLTLSFLSIILFCSPAKAGKLLSWELNDRDNSLVFITDEGVQPQAQLLANPARLVIDLPGTVLGRETIKEDHSGAIRSFRIGQPDPQTTRIVVEFAPGYTIDPERVRFRGISATQWEVSLPSPRIAPFPSSESPTTIAPSPVNSLSPLISPAAAAQPPTSISSNTVTGSPYVKVTRNGFYIEIDGSRQTQIQQTIQGDRLNFDLEGITLPQDLASQSVAVNEYGVSEIEFTQVERDLARISLKLDDIDSNWLATFSRIKGLILVPRGQLLSTSESPPTDVERPTLRKTQPTAIERPTLTTQNEIESLELTDGDSQLLVSATEDIAASSQVLSNGIYEITFDNARISEDFQGPELESDSPISEIRVRQSGESVKIWVTTRLRFRLGSIDRLRSNTIALPIEEGLTLPPRSNDALIPPTTIDVPKATALPSITPSLRPRNRPLVILDAGHGGQDPGTIGINNLTEKHIVLPISLDVAEILRKEGIDVQMTRDTDNFISLQGRTDRANQIDADLFVSIHANAINLSRPDVNGLETYYYQSGRRLAEIIHWSVLNGVNIRDRGIRRARFYVLRHSKMPAALVEVGFATGAEDAPRLESPTHRRQMAEAIARGIIQYIKENNL
jgi:N-acetylmuramoyl-L-alanine amidase